MTRAGTAAPNHTLKCGGDPLDKTVLLEVMPVGLVHAAAPVRAGARKGRARLVGTLLMGRRILVSENLLGFQVGKFLVAVIAQEQRFASVADKNHGVVGDCELVHMLLLKRAPVPPSHLSGRA
jgi:hypothetical protein